MHEQRIQITAISGSFREGSYSKLAIETALSALRARGIPSKQINLQDYDLPFCRGEDAQEPGVKRFREDIKHSTSLILASPEYHGSYSGVLKNALDLLRTEDIEGKLCALIGISEGIHGAINVLADLREVLRTLKAWAIPTQVCISRVSQQFDSRGKARNPGIQKRLTELAEELLFWTQIFLHGQASLSKSQI